MYEPESPGHPCSVRPIVMTTGNAAGTSGRATAPDPKPKGLTVGAVS